MSSSRKRLLLLIASITLASVAGSPVPSLIPSLKKHQRVQNGRAASQQQIVARGGALEAGDKTVVGRFSTGGPDSRMPSLFSSDEAEYNRFAACLAATEGLRRMRDQALLDRSRKGSGSAMDEEHKIAAHYQENSGRVLRAMGMPVDRFNELGREISQDEKLKEKVSANEK